MILLFHELEAVVCLKPQSPEPKQIVTNQVCLEKVKQSSSVLAMVRLGYMYIKCSVDAWSACNMTAQSRICVGAHLNLNLMIWADIDSSWVTANIYIVHYGVINDTMSKHTYYQGTCHTNYYIHAAQSQILAGNLSRVYRQTVRCPTLHRHGLRSWTPLELLCRKLHHVVNQSARGWWNHPMLKLFDLALCSISLSGIATFIRNDSDCFWQSVCYASSQSLSFSCVFHQCVPSILMEFHVDCRTLYISIRGPLPDLIVSWFVTRLLSYENISKTFRQTT